MNHGTVIDRMEGLNRLEMRRLMKVFERIVVIGEEGDVEAVARMLAGQAVVVQVVGDGVEVILCGN